MQQRLKSQCRAKAPSLHPLVYFIRASRSAALRAAAVAHFEKPRCIVSKAWYSMLRKPSMEEAESGSGVWNEDA